MIIHTKQTGVHENDCTALSATSTAWLRDLGEEAFHRVGASVSSGLEAVLECRGFHVEICELGHQLFRWIDAGVRPQGGDVRASFLEIGFCFLDLGRELFQPRVQGG